MTKAVGTRWIAVIILLIASLGFPATAHAQGIIYGDTIPAGTTVDHDVLLIGQNVSLAGTVNGNVFILGNQISVSGTVDGSLILVGQNVTIAGSISGAAYGAALTLDLGPTAALNRDLYVSAVSLVSESGSHVGRDLFALSLDAGLNGQIGRDPHTAIGPIQLYNGIMQLLGFNELTIKLHIDLPAPPAGQGNDPSLVMVSALRPVHARSVHPQAKPFDWNAWAINQAREWVVLSIFGLIAFWLAGRQVERAGTPLAARPWKTLGVGLLALVIVFNLFGLALLLAVLIFCLGLGLNYIGLWQLSIALWIASYASIAVALVALWFFVVYGTKLVAVAVVSNWLSGKMARSSAWSKLVIFVLGLLVYVLLRSVPFVGWVFGTLITAMGLGSTWLAYRALSQTPPHSEAVSAAPPASVPGVFATKRAPAKKQGAAADAR